MGKNEKIALIIFSKVPETGKVKTRLKHGLIDAEFSMELQCAMLKDTILMFKELTSNVIPVLAFYPDNKLSALKKLILAPLNAMAPELIAKIRLVSQLGETTGERFTNIFFSVFKEFSVDSVLIIGADTPHLQPALIEQAIGILRSSPETAVLGPSYKGGFYILGVKHPYQDIGSIFQYPNELIKLMDFLTVKKNTVHLLPEVTDVDTFDDLRTVRAIIKLLSHENSVSLKYYCPRFTFELLERLNTGLWD